MFIRKGTYEDIAQIMKIVSETLQMMQEEGNDQWNAEYPSSNDFEKDVQNEALYVMSDEQEEKVLGAISIDQEQPDMYDRVSWRRNGSAIVLHRLLVATEARKLGIASKLMNFSSELAIEKGIDYIKTDTYSINKKAASLFEKLGFQFVGETTFEGRKYPFICFDKIL